MLTFRKVDISIKVILNDCFIKKNISHNHNRRLLKSNLKNFDCTFYYLQFFPFHFYVYPYWLPAGFFITLRRCHKFYIMGLIHLLKIYFFLHSMFLLSSNLFLFDRVSVISPRKTKKKHGSFRTRFTEASVFTVF